MPNSSKTLTYFGVEVQGNLAQDVYCVNVGSNSELCTDSSFEFFEINSMSENLPFTTFDPISLAAMGIGIPTGVPDGSEKPLLI